MKGAITTEAPTNTHNIEVESVAAGTKRTLQKSSSLEALQLFWKHGIHRTRHVSYKAR